jgi:hypothetical protein
LPSVSRVRVEAGRDHVLVVEDVSFPRGDWREGDLDLYAAFGAPGPMAVDARLFSTPAEAPEPAADEAGEAVHVTTATRRDSTAHLLLGKALMAGVFVHLSESQVRRALSGGRSATLRLRSLLRPPGADGDGASDVVVRLGAVDGLPLTLERIQVVSLEKEPLSRAEARLCGPEADPWPLEVSVLPRAARRAAAPAIAPSMAVRHASDDLCIRWWAAP